MSSKYLPTIGIEIHVQLATKSKMFCACDNESRTAEPNTNICPVCLALPGTLPVINKSAVEMAIKFGLAIGAKVAWDGGETKFDRKNYFYPDSPKGYQISQFDKPIVHDGAVEILAGGEFMKIGVERAHLEEDAGKLIHPAGADYSLVDLNRAGTPLLEIVSHPAMHSAAEAKRYLQEIYNIATSLGITDGDMEHGNFKFDLNISLSDDLKKLGKKVELKNLNSFRNAERALNYEIKRQTELLEKGQAIEQETRGWHDAKAITFSQRGKEEAFDYRYFPEPDLPPLLIKADMIERLRQTLPKRFPIDIRRALHQAGLSEKEQDILVSQPATFEIYETAVEKMESEPDKKMVKNLLIGDYQAWLTENPSKKSALSGGNLAALVKLVSLGEISSKIAKNIFTEVISGQPPAKIIKSRGLTQISDEAELENIIKGLIDANPKAVADYQAGHEKAVGFFVGAVMKATKGQANPSKVNQILLRYLQK